MFGWMLPRGLGKLPLPKMHFGGIVDPSILGSVR